MALTVGLAACGDSSSKLASPEAGGRTSMSSASVGSRFTTFAKPRFAAQTFNTGFYTGESNSSLGISVSTDGLAVTYSNWVENGHFARVLDPNSGAALGPFDNYSGGIRGAAIDSTYIYLSRGDGRVQRSYRSAWVDPSYDHTFDNGSTTGVFPLRVDSHRPLGQIVLCDSRLYVIDQGKIAILPTSLSEVLGTFSAPGATSIACDKEGDIWVVENFHTAVRFDSAGHAVLGDTFNFADSNIVGISGDPTGNDIWVADNGRDQNFKQFNYTGTQTGSLGVVGGYLADGGRVNSSHFVGPRGIAVDSSGNLYTDENGAPGQNWYNADLNSDVGTFGIGSIYTKFRADGSVAWRVFGGGWDGPGQPTADMSTFYDAHWEYRRGPDGNYDVPYAYTVDPWTYPSDVRLSLQDGQFAGTTFTWDADRHRYLGVESAYSGGPYRIYIQDAGSEIFHQVKSFPAGCGPANCQNGPSDYYRDDSGSIWAVASNGLHITQYKLTGYAADGTPHFDSGTTYSPPPELTDVRRVEVHGNTIYVSGFDSSDPNPDKEFDGWKSMGRHLLRFDSLPTSRGWPSPRWEIGPLYTGTSSTHEWPYTISFTVNDTGQVGIAWVKTVHTQEALDIYSAADGAMLKSDVPIIPNTDIGWADQDRSLTARGSWFVAEDDGHTQNILICGRPSGCK